MTKDGELRLSTKRGWAALGLPDIEDLSQRLHFAPTEGRIWLDDQRMLLLHLAAVGALRRELVDTVGLDAARGLFARCGHQAGSRDGLLARKVRPTGSPFEAFSVGPQLHALEGAALVEPVRLELDAEKGKFYGEFLWHDSAEADAHLSALGVSAAPACWMQLGYASGYTSVFMGTPIVYREVECRAAGDARCRIIGKPIAEWGDEAVERDYRVQDFVGGVAPASYHGVVGVSSGFTAVAHRVAQAAETRVSVLFLGETGVGKERFAKLLHAISDRKHGPFVALNCAAMPDNLVESELFGVTRGAFTGASETRPGKFERANGGTIFLDEVGLLSLAAQAKLLRVLQEREVERVGGSDPIPVDVRVVAATNAELEQAVADKTFRADLFYRLSVFPIRIPPLRERRDDIPALIQHFLAKYQELHGKQVSGFTQSALQALLEYDFPGNVRELENMIERGVVMAPRDKPIDGHHLLLARERIGGSFALASDGSLRRTRPEPEAAPNGLIDEVLAAALPFAELEHLLLTRAVEQAEGNFVAAAKRLGISRAQLAYRLKKNV